MINAGALYRIAIILHATCTEMADFSPVTFMLWKVGVKYISQIAKAPGKMILKPVPNPIGAGIIYETTGYRRFKLQNNRR